MNAMLRNVPADGLGFDLRHKKADMLGQHDRYFSTVLADSPALREAAHALRFQVYCLERKFENAEEHPSGLEFDAYDANAVQGVLIHRPTHGAIGSVRMILPNADADDSFPIMKLLQASSLDLSHYVKLANTIEVSRFAISKEFRRRDTDQLESHKASRAESAMAANLAFLSLLQFVLRESIKREVFFWTAVMEPKFLRLLARMGICYEPIGPLVMHHGIRQPCYCYLPNMLENARLTQPECWNVLTNGGVLEDELLAKIGNLAAF